MGKLLLHCFLLFAFLSCCGHFVFAKSKRISAYIIDELPEEYSAHKKIFKGLVDGKLKYHLLTDSKKDLEALDFDVQVAFQIWFQSLGLNVQLERVTNVASAQVLFNYSQEPLSNEDKWDAPAFYFFYAEGSVTRPIVELRRHLRCVEYSNLFTWDLLEKETKVPVKGRAGKKSFEDLKNLIGEDMSDPSKIAEYILSHKFQKLKFGDLVTFNGRNYLYSLALLVHELGHVFGLDDLYLEANPEYKVPQYPSVMKIDSWQSLAPSHMDIARVKRLLTQPLKKACQRALART